MKTVIKFKLPVRPGKFYLNVPEDFEILSFGLQRQDKFDPKYQPGYQLPVLWGTTPNPKSSKIIELILIETGMHNILPEYVFLHTFNMSEVGYVLHLFSIPQ